MQADDEFIARLNREPWLYGFLSLMRRIGANPRIDSPGTALRLNNEPFRLGQKPSLAFAPREIANAEAIDGRLHVRLFGLGMLGPNGPLPIHVTEIAREREEVRRDVTLVDFLDVFHHRALSLLYRTWASAQSTTGLDRPQEEPFSYFMSSLIGQDAGELAARDLEAHAQLGASAHAVRESCNPEALCRSIERYFEVPVSLDEYVFQWIEIDVEERTRLGDTSEAAVLGAASMLGERVPDRQCGFRLVIGPVDLEKYLRFTPKGEDLPPLVDWVRSFVGRQMRWELEVQVSPESAVGAKLDGGQQLGWSSWLGESPRDQPITGMRFVPEQYADSFARRFDERERTQV
jgi:type VI secretion system protein ImpH